MTQSLSPDDIARLRELEARATPGPWTTEKPAMDSATGFVSGSLVAATAPRQGIYAEAPRGTFPEDDRKLIAFLRNLARALLAAAEENAWLRAENTQLGAQFDSLTEQYDDALSRLARAERALRELHDNWVTSPGARKFILETLAALDPADPTPPPKEP